MPETVCLCNSTIAWGGGEKWHLDAALSLAARGWRVLLLCHPDGALFARAPKDTANLEVVPIAIGRLSFLNPLFRKRLTDFFRKERPRAVIMNLAADLKAAGLAAKAAGVRHIVFRRGLALPVRDSVFNRYLYSRVITRFIANSQATLDMALANNPALIPKERTTVLFNGIDAGFFDAELLRCAETLKAASMSGASGDDRLVGLAAMRMASGGMLGRPLVIGNAGRLNVQKGQHLLLHLVKCLTDKGQDVRLVIAGEGEREEELKNLAQSLGIEDKVLFTGFMADLSCFWQAIDVFVLSSFWEGFGFVLLEAMLAQKPIMAFAVSNIPELITNGENGYLFPLPQGEETTVPEAIVAAAERESAAAPAEREPVHGMASEKNRAGQDGTFPENMAEVLMRLAGEPDRACAMGSAGRSFALAQFSQDASMDRLEGLLR